MTVVLREVAPGTRVRFPDCRKEAVVCFHTPCSSTIQYQTVTTRDVVVNKGTEKEKVVTFTRREEKVTVSGGSLVEVL